MTPQIAIVDDHPLLRAGLAAALRGELSVDGVSEASSSEQALELARREALDLAIMDLLLPKGSGVSLAGQLLELQPRCKILGLSASDEPVLVASILRAGATGCALKTQPVVEVVEAVRTVLNGLRYLAPSIARDAVEAELIETPTRPLERLTPREREVFDLLIRGHNTDEISSILFIARRTVETHRQRIANKLSARSIVEMIRIAARHGALGA